MRSWMRFAKPSFWATCSVPIVRCASTFVFQETSLPDLPDKSISIPSTDQFTNEYLIRQSSKQSAQAASRLLLFLVSAVDECLQNYMSAKNELADLYEMSGQYSLTEDGEARVIELRQIVNRRKKELQDLELLFEYSKKLMDANSEVTFLVGEDYCSKQMSDQIYNATTHIKRQMETLGLAELDLIQAQTSHIEKSSKNNTQ